MTPFARMFHPCADKNPVVADVSSKTILNAKPRSLAFISSVWSRDYKSATTGGKKFLYEFWGLLIDKYFDIVGDEVSKVQAEVEKANLEAVKTKAEASKAKIKDTANNTSDGQ